MVSNFSSVVVASLLSSELIFVLQDFSRNGTNSKLLEKLIKLWRKWYGTKVNASYCGVEAELNLGFLIFHVNSLVFPSYEK